MSLRRSYVILRRRVSGKARRSALIALGCSVTRIEKVYTSSGLVEGTRNNKTQKQSVVPHAAERLELKALWGIRCLGRYLEDQGT